jgi:hypothetical protein
MCAFMLKALVCTSCAPVYIFDYIFPSFQVSNRCILILNSQSAVCVRIHEPEHVSPQIIISLSLVCISSTLDMDLRCIQTSLPIEAVGHWVGWDWVELWLKRSIVV